MTLTTGVAQMRAAFLPGAARAGRSIAGIGAGDSSSKGLSKPVETALRKIPVSVP